MTDDKMTSSEPMDPVQTTVVGVGDANQKYLPSGTIATTPGENQPNIVITVVKPITALAVRFAHNYVTALVALITAGMTSEAIPASNFGHLVLECAGLAFAGAAVMVLKDLVTIFGRLEEQFPLLTGKV